MAKKVTRTILCIVCALLLCSYSVFTPVAEALTATMSLSLAVTALAVLIISSIGVTITAPSGQDVTDYVGGRFQSWVAGQGYNDIGGWFSASTGITLASYVAHVFSGVLAVGKLAYDAIKQFVQFFVQNEGIQAGGSSVGQMPSQNYGLYSGSVSSSGLVIYNNTSPVTSTLSSNGKTLTLSGSSTATWVMRLADGEYSYTISTSAANYSTASIRLAQPLGSTNNNNDAGATRILSSARSGTLYVPSGKSLAWGYQGGASGYSVTITLTRTSSGVIGSNAGAVFSPDTNILDLPSLTDDESYELGSDVITGAMSTTEALAAVTNLAATADGIKVSSAVGDQPVNPPSTGPVTGLQDVFPFCLPFDFARFVGILSATRAAPEFDWIIPIPAATGLGIGDQYIHIDLSDFDPAAEILRTAELLAAAIGLILLTRDLLKW